MSGYVLAIAGSPRRGGNSDALLDAAADAMRGRDTEVEKLIVSERSIEPCRGCNACSKTGQCVIDDEMQQLYPLVDEAAGLLVSTPVFFASVPSGLKAFFDRMQPYWARRYVLGQETPVRRPGGLLVVRGGGDPYGSDCAVKVTQSVFAVLAIDIAGEVLVEGVDSPDDLREHPEALEEAARLGEKLAEEVDGC